MLVPRRRTKGPLDFDDLPFTSPAITAPSAPVSPPPPTLQTKDLTFLLHPTSFHPLPTSSLLPPFLSAPAPTSTDPTELLSTFHFRAAAIASAAALTSTPPPSNTQILELWYTRLLSLCLSNAHSLAAQEIKAFQDLSAPFYLSPETGRSILPWELRVLAVSLGAGTDPRRAIGAYYELASECRTVAADQSLLVEERKVWRDRLKDLGIRVANALVMLGDFAAAVRHLKGLTATDKGLLPLLMIRAGMLDEARGMAGDDEILEGLLLMAEGEWAAAAEVWARLPPGEVVTCNAAICELYLAQPDNVCHPTPLYNHTPDE